MEKNVKGIYDISCNWYIQCDGYYISPARIAETWTEDSNGLANGSWKGKIIAFDDNTCIGYASERKLGGAKQLLIGSILDNKGANLCKINSDNVIFDASLFHVYSNSLANDIGKDDTYYGEIVAKSDYYYQELGFASIKATPKSKIDEKEILEIINDYQAVEDEIRDNNPFGAMLIDMNFSLDPRQTTFYLEEGSKKMIDAILPPILQEEILSSQINENNEKDRG